MTNLTDETPSAIQFNLHAELDWETEADLIWPAGGGSGECDGDSGGFYCYADASLAPELLPAPGGTVDLPFDIHIRAKEPFEGRFSIEAGMAWGKGRMEFSAAKWFTLEVVNDAEADLAVVAPDVKQSVRVDAGGLVSSGTLNPGETGAVRYQVVNQGRKAVSGVKVTLGLPEGVTFNQPAKDCVVDDDRRTAVCTYDALALVPVDQDTDPKDDTYSAVELHSLVTVSDTVKAPVTLGGGTVQVEGLTEQVEDATEQVGAQSEPVRTELPANAVAVPAADVDASDNQDGFAVVVAPSRTGGGDDDGGSGGGELPITGPQTGPIAGAGLLLVVGGCIMLLLARRRNRLPNA